MNNLLVDLRSRRRKPQGLCRLSDNQGGEAYRHPNNTSSKPATRHINLEGAMIGVRAAGMVGGPNKIGRHNIQGKDKETLWQSFRKGSIRSQKPARKPSVPSSPRSKPRCKSSTKAAVLSQGARVSVLMMLMTPAFRVLPHRATLTPHPMVLAEQLALPGTEVNLVQACTRQPRQFHPLIHDPIPAQVPRLP